MVKDMLSYLLFMNKKKIERGKEKMVCVGVLPASGYTNKCSLLLHGRKKLNGLENPLH